MAEQAVAPGDDLEAHLLVVRELGFECALAVVESGHVRPLAVRWRDRASRALAQRARGMRTCATGNATEQLMRPALFLEFFATATSTTRPRARLNRLELHEKRLGLGLVGSQFVHQFSKAPLERYQLFIGGRLCGPQQSLQQRWVIVSQTRLGSANRVFHPVHFRSKFRPARLQLLEPCSMLFNSLPQSVARLDRRCDWPGVPRSCQDLRESIGPCVPTGAR